MIILGNYDRIMLKEKIDRHTLNSIFSTYLPLFLTRSIFIYFIISHLSEVDLVYFKCEEEVKIFGKNED